MDSENRILVVDDDLDILELLEYNLAREGYQVHCVHDPTKAKQEAIAFQPTLIILDAVMPELDGFSLCRNLRQSPQFADVPIFMLTALIESRHEHDAWQCGADDFIHKMLGLRSLTRRVELVLQRKFIIRKRDQILRVGKWALFRNSRLVVLKDRSIALGPEEFEVIYFVAQNAERWLTVENVEQVINGANLFHGNTSVEKSLHELFKKLGKHWLRYRGLKRFQFNAG